MITHSPIVFDDLRPAPAKARARRTDCRESHDAAKRVEASGICERQRAAIYDCLKTHGPQTMTEVSYRYFWSKEALTKRVNSVAGIACTGESRNGSRVWSIV